MRRIPQPEHDIHFSQGATNAAVQPLVHLTAVLGLKTGRIDEYKLRRVGGENAAQRQTRGLCFARSDGDFLANQTVE